MIQRLKNLHFYKLEKELKETYSSNKNYYDIRFKVRAEKLAPIINNFIEYVEREIKDALPRSPLVKRLRILCFGLIKSLKI